VIEAEIAHERSIALDALGRRWRMIFGRMPPADAYRLASLSRPGGNVQGF